MNNCLIIFIDGFPYELLGKLDFLNRFSYKCALIPGIGYSVNIHAEIFAGLTADQIGFFNTWKFEPAKSPFRVLKSIKGLLSNFEDSRYLNWVFRNGIKFICGFDSLNIPYKFIDMFTPCGYSIYSKDFLEAKFMPDETFVELDSVGHKFGLDSEQYNNSLNRLNSWVNNLCDRFGSVHPDGHIVVLSDHGMSKVKRVIKLDLKKDFSSKEISKLIYFLDTTMLRIWYLDSEVKGAIESFLNNKDYGRLLTDEERIDFGIANKIWADSIFLLNEGCVFAPSFLEKGYPLAMHGYHPRLPWQKGIFLYSGPMIFTAQDTITAKECYNMLKEIIKSGKN